jgi:hypothetical protein
LLKPKPLTRWPAIVALAASLAVVVIGVTLSRWNAPPAASRLVASVASLVDERGSMLPVGTTQSLMRLRGHLDASPAATPYDAAIELPPARAAIELRLLPDDMTPSAGYRVTLSRIVNDDVEVFATVTELHPAADGFVTVFADSAALAPGNYEVTVVADGGGVADRTSFTIKVLPASGH